MKNEKMLHAIGQIDDELIYGAVNDVKAKQTKKHSWRKWAAMAACLCLVVVGAFSMVNFQGDPSSEQAEDEQQTMDQLYSLSQQEVMSVELVEWSVDRFKGIVVDAGNNSVFPANAELSVVFEYDTKIILEDGTSLMFNPDEPDTESIGWDVGDVIHVEFLNYCEYKEGNHFYNQVIASIAQKTDYEVVTYAVPADYAPADLYIATTTGLDEYDAHMATNYGEKYLGKSVRVFSFIEETAAENFNVWYFDYEDTSITRIYYVTKSEDKLVTAWSEAGNLGKAIEALASLTSEDTPLYLALHDEMVFAVIGDTAYYLPDFSVLTPEVTYMPGINTVDLETKNIILLSGECLELPDKEP